MDKMRIKQIKKEISKKFPGKCSIIIKNEFPEEVY